MNDTPTNAELPDALEEWLEAFFTSGKGDDAEDVEALREYRNATSAALWTLLHSKTVPELDEPARDVIRKLLKENTMTGQRDDWFEEQAIAAMKRGAYQKAIVFALLQIANMIAGIRGAINDRTALEREGQR